MGRFNASRNSLAGEQVSRFAAPNAVGGGFDGAAKAQTRIQKINGEIITTILVDLQGLLVSGTVKDVIGEDGVAAAYITQITTAKNGVIYKAEMSCIEAPAGSNTTADIDLVSNSDSLAEDATFDSAGTATALIVAGGAYTKGMYKITAASTNLSNCVSDYLYLTNGSGANSGGTYTAGKFVIKLYGSAFT
tara:strand:+ start:1813 stop:2385 length:573 start_codon:yes stop_codon:yes gene_type:complete